MVKEMLEDKGIYIIVDFEATCSDTDEFPRNEMEIIEIGALAVNKADLVWLGEFNAFVKPIIHPNLTDFCKNLTSIRQEDVDKAKIFSGVIKEFTIWLSQYDNPIFCSWGNYDRNQLRNDCKYHNILYPFNDEHINLKELFSKKQNLGKRYGTGKALIKVGIEYEGKRHRGIDDVRNIYKLIPYIFGQKKIIE